jgi:hypothetical protein
MYKDHHGHEKQKDQDKKLVSFVMPFVDKNPPRHTLHARLCWKNMTLSILPNQELPHAHIQEENCTAWLCFVKEWVFTVHKQSQMVVSKTEGPGAT